MLTSATHTLLLLGVFTAVSEAITPWNEEQRWVSEMLDPARYDVATRPVENVTDAVEVTVEMSVVSILRLDSKNQLLTAPTSSNMAWEDKRLSWNPSEYNGLKSIVVKANKVWHPDILVLNAMDETILLSDNAELLITSKGKLYVSVTRVHTVQCYLHHAKFPFDTQVCRFILGLMGTPSDVITLTALQRIQRKELTTETANWMLKNVSLVEGYLHACIGLEDLDDASCQRVSLVTTWVCLQRVPLYYIYMVMVPITILTAMASCVFWLPPECGEKLSFSVSVFFGFVIFQLVLQDDLVAAGNERPSVLIRYVLFSFTLSGVAVIVSAITLILRHKSNSPERRDQDITKETFTRSGNTSQESIVQNVHVLRSTKKVPRYNWKRVAVYVDRISCALFWVAYTSYLVTLLVEIGHDDGCPYY